MRAPIICVLAAVTLTAQPPSDCAADGTVVNSLTGQALPRANVVPSSTNGSGTSTDAEGKWTISNLTCGQVVFAAEKDGYLQNGYGRAASRPLSSGTGPIRWGAEHKSFVLPDVQPGKYRINVNSTGAGYFVKSVRLNDHELRNHDFTIDGPTGPIEIGSAMKAAPFRVRLPTATATPRPAGSYCSAVSFPLFRAAIRTMEPSVFRTCRLEPARHGHSTTWPTSSTRMKTLSCGTQRRNDNQLSLRVCFRASRLHLAATLLR